jgi:hypothetical protein
MPSAESGSGEEFPAELLFPRWHAKKSGNNPVTLPM